MLHRHKDDICYILYWNNTILYTYSIRAKVYSNMYFESLTIDQFLREYWHILCIDQWCGVLQFLGWASIAHFQSFCFFRAHSKESWPFCHFSEEHQTRTNTFTWLLIICNVPYLLVTWHMFLICHYFDQCFCKMKFQYHCGLFVPIVLYPLCCDPT